MNVYEVITARILASLDKGVVPWRCTWNRQSPRNLVSGHEYRGVNVLLLQSTSFTSPYWLTFKQAEQLGGTVKRGERGMPVIFWKSVDEEENAKPKGRKKKFILRYFTVFNATQTEGVTAPSTPATGDVDPIAACEAIVANYANPPSVVHGSMHARYNVRKDLIEIPHRSSFHSAEGYYATMFHELAHSTGAAHRLARKAFVTPSVAAHAYAFEELVAEIASAFLCARGGISPATIENSAAYVSNWASALKANPRAVIEASTQAMQAADLILGAYSANPPNGPRCSSKARREEEKG